MMLASRAAYRSCALRPLLVATPSSAGRVLTRHWSSQRCGTTASDYVHRSSSNIRHVPLGRRYFESAANLNADSLRELPASGKPRLQLHPQDGSPHVSFKTPAPLDFDVDISWTQSRLYVSKDGKSADVTMGVIGLRDNCNCSICRDPSSSQKTFKATDLNLAMWISDVAPSNEGLYITIQDDGLHPRTAASEGHRVLCPWSSLEHFLGQPQPSFNAYERRFRKQTGVSYWDGPTMKAHARSIDYEEYLHKDNAMWDVIVDLSRYGLVFLNNVPKDQDAVKLIADRIARVESTFYGETFDVRAKPNAENVAYTSDRLDLHQDLLYLSSPPQIQILHCLENSCAGGESTFSDGERVAKLLNMKAGESLSIQALRHNTVNYGYQANGYSYRWSRNVLPHDPESWGRGMDVDSIWWSPPFESPLGFPNLTDHGLRGRRLVQRLINDDDAVYERKLRPGECVLFDNRRVMHGRNKFDTSQAGSRWLRGAYIGRQDYFSKTSLLPSDVLQRIERDDPSLWKPLESPEDIKGHQVLLDLLKKDNEDILRSGKTMPQDRATENKARQYQ